MKLTEVAEGGKVAAGEASNSITTYRRKFKATSDQEAAAAASQVVEEARRCSRNFRCGDNRIYSSGISLMCFKTISRTIESVK